MSWLNTQGQQLVQSKALDIANYLNAMSLIASNYYATGASLYVPSDVVTYLANLSDITLPEIYVMDCFDYNHYNVGDGSYDLNYHCVIGRVDCGDRNLIKTIPFGSVTELHNGTNNGTSSPIFYTLTDFVNTESNAYKSGVDNKLYPSLTNFFASAQWACLTNPSINPNLDGFFLVTIRDDTSKAGDAPNWSLAIGTDSVGTNVDRMAFLDTRSGGCGVPDLVSNVVSVAVATTPPYSNGVVGLAQSVSVEITNQTSIQAYGTTISFVLSNAFDFGGASGSQGYASVSNGIVTYTVGPLLAGATADINLKLIPLRAGVVVPGTSPSLSLGAGLNNSSPAITAFFSPIQSVAPTLNSARGPGGTVQLDWRSDTDRLLLESSPVLGSGASWSSLDTSGTIVDGNHRFLPQQVAGKQGYFRLHSQ